MSEEMGISETVCNTGKTSRHRGHRETMRECFGSDPGVDFLLRKLW